MSRAKEIAKKVVVGSAVVGMGVVGSIAIKDACDAWHEGRERQKHVADDVAMETPAGVLRTYKSSSPTNYKFGGQLVESVGKRWGLTTEEKEIWHAILMRRLDLDSEFIARVDGVVFSNYSPVEMGRVAGLGTKWQEGNIENEEVAKTSIMSEIKQVQDDIKSKEGQPDMREMRRIEKRRWQDEKSRIDSRPKLGRTRGTID